MARSPSPATSARNNKTPPPHTSPPHPPLAPPGLTPPVKHSCSRSRGRSRSRAGRKRSRSVSVPAVRVRKRSRKQSPLRSSSRSSSRSSASSRSSKASSSSSAINRSKAKDKTQKRDKELLAKTIDRKRLLEMKVERMVTIKEAGAAAPLWHLCWAVFGDDNIEYSVREREIPAFPMDSTDRVIAWLNCLFKFLLRKGYKKLAIIASDLSAQVLNLRRKCSGSTAASDRAIAQWFCDTVAENCRLGKRWNKQTQIPSEPPLVLCCCCSFSAGFLVPDRAKLLGLRACLKSPLRRCLLTCCKSRSCRHLRRLHYFLCFWFGAVFTLLHNTAPRASPSWTKQSSKPSSYSSGSGSSFSYGSGPSTHRKCYGCGASDHWVAQCHKRKRSYSPPRQRYSYERDYAPRGGSFGSYSTSSGTAPLLGSMPHVQQWKVFVGALSAWSSSLLREVFGAFFRCSQPRSVRR